MTEVSFHTGVPDPLGHACRLLRKAVRLGSRVAVTATTPALSELDRALWTFEPLEFIPHLMRRAGQPVAPRHAVTPVWLVERAADAPHPDVLLNLGEAVPEGFERFARVIEVVGTAPEQVASGRARWKHYAGQGLAITHHVMSGEDAR